MIVIKAFQNYLHVKPQCFVFYSTRAEATGYNVHSSTHNITILEFLEGTFDETS